MKIILSGYNGKMGREVRKFAGSSDGYDIVCGVDPADPAPGESPCFGSFGDIRCDADVIVDFSHHSLTAEMVDFAVKRSLPMVIATTGQTEAEYAMIKEAAEIVPVFLSSNYSFGIALLVELAKEAAAAMPNAEIEIVEVHHDRKADAPSGTALSIAGELKNVRTDANIVCGRSGHGKRAAEDIGISSVRIGNVVGIHEVMIGTQNQTITLKHEAHSRALFAEGALKAADFIIGKAPGLYDMKSLL